MEGCKSLHFHHPCRLPARHGPTIQAGASEIRPAGRREEVNKVALRGLDMERRDPEGQRTKLNVKREAEDAERKRRKKSKQYTMLGNSTFYHA